MKILYSYHFHKLSSSTILATLIFSSLLLGNSIPISTFAQSSGIDKKTVEVKIPLDLEAAGARGGIPTYDKPPEPIPKDRDGKEIPGVKDSICGGYIDFVAQGSSEMNKLAGSYSVTLNQNATVDDFTKSFQAIINGSGDGTIAEYASTKSYTGGDTDAGAIARLLVNSAESAMTSRAEALAEGCNNVPEINYPTKITFIVTTSKTPDPKCFDDSSQVPPQQVTGSYKGSVYSLSYYQTGKTLTWFGGPNDSWLKAYPNITGSITGQKLRTLTGNYAAYPINKNLPPGGRVIMPKESYRGESNYATNQILRSVCLHVCKVDSVGGQKDKVKAEVWLPLVDRGPAEAYKIDISPAAYQSLKDQLKISGGTTGGAGLSGFGAQLEYCK